MVNSDSIKGVKTRRVSRRDIETPCSKYDFVYYALCILHYCDEYISDNACIYLCHVFSTEEMISKKNIVDI